MMLSRLLLASGMLLALSACGGSDPEPPQYGANPALRFGQLRVGTILHRRRVGAAGAERERQCADQKGRAHHSTSRAGIPE